MTDPTGRHSVHAKYFEINMGILWGVVQFIFQHTLYLLQSGVPTRLVRLTKCVQI